jgi:DNA excision repair protein ERCC-2
MEINLEKKRLILSVRELARMVSESSEMAGGVSLSLRGKLGARAHRAYQENRRKSAEFRQEVHLDVPILADEAGAQGWEIRVRGRLDGLVEELDRLVVEELKTVALPAEKFRSLSADQFPSHRRQLEIYLYLLSIARPDKPAAGRLIYLNLVSGKKRSFDIAHDSNAIGGLISDVVASLLDREVRREQERALKREAASALRFPFRTMRPGQEEIIRGVCEALEKRSPLLMEAPTGLGKTAAVLFGALPFALRHDRLVMFLTSKTTQQDLVFETARRIRCGEVFPRTILLRAKEKLCFLEDEVCSPEECEYLEDFELRIRRSNAVPDLLAQGDIHPDRLSEIARRERLCPHALQIGLAEEMDLIIGDYNYAFDPVCRLSRLFSEGDPSRLILIVDEAHNLPDRARSYYSMRLSWEEVAAAAKHLENKSHSGFEEPLTEIQRQFEYYLANAPKGAEASHIQLSAPAWQRIAEMFEAAVVPYWFGLHDDAAEITEDPVISLQWRLEDFVKILSLEGENFAHLARREPEPALEILCLDAAPLLSKTFSAVHGVIGLSATLKPFPALRRLLELPEEIVSLEIASPFSAENCRIMIDPTVTTVYRERQAHLHAMAQKIQEFHRLLKRNTLVFFPSFDYMGSILEKLEIKKIFVQKQSWIDAQRDEALSEFKQSRGALFLAVMGGVFAEGIDLPGRLAEAAIIVGVPLPLVCLENELMRAYFENTDRCGFEYAYLYPGMRRVIQAAGRVIRAESDRGIILLLDRRFAQGGYRELLPAHWYRNSPAELVCKDWEMVMQKCVSFFCGGEA